MGSLVNEQDPITRQTIVADKESLAEGVTANSAQAESLSANHATEALTHKGTKIVSFRSLCRCGDEVWIENDGTIYRLRRTKLGKLILTK